MKKKIRTIEDQGERQIKAIQDQGQVKTIKKYTYDDKDTPLISKQKEIFNKPVDERLEEITNLDKKKVNSDDLIYRYEGNIPDEKFHKFDNVFSVLDIIKTGKISLTGAKNDQVKFKSNLGEIIRRNSKKIPKEPNKNTLYNIKMLCKARKKAIKFLDDYSSMVSEVKTKATEGAGLRILTP